MSNDDLRAYLKTILGSGGSLGGLEGMSDDDAKSSLCRQTTPRYSMNGVASAAFATANDFHYQSHCC